jgi:hypothetical protein
MKIVCCVILMMAVLNSSAQSVEEKAIKTTIDQFFLGMRNADSVMIAQTISPTAVFQTIMLQADGAVKVETESIPAFLQFVGKPHLEIYDEQISYGSILIDADLASVFTPFKFYLGKKFSHCGVNSFQLVKLKGVWKIQYIIDTRRKTDCVGPD